MKQEKKYVAYVGTYTHGTSVGIHLYDVDCREGSFTERKVIPINNPSHLTVSKDGRFLYSIADEGVAAFRILPDGDLDPINEKWIGGMRGCYVEVDNDNHFLFVGGYHDGRVTMMRLREDGGIDSIADGIFHKGLGLNIGERNFYPHVTCVKLIPSMPNFLCAVDSGLDHVKVYKIDEAKGKLKLMDIIRCQLDSGPRMMRFTKKGNFAYVLCELKNIVEVYQYEKTASGPVFERIQTIETTDSKDFGGAGANGMELSRDERYLFCSNAGSNDVVIFEIDPKTGLLSTVCNSKISGDYPKSLGIFPDDQHFVSLNHDSNAIMTFSVNYEKKYFLMKGRPISIETPNCIRIHELR